VDIGFASRDPHFVLPASICLLLMVRARNNILSNPPRRNRFKLLVQIALPVAKIVIATALPSGVLIAWLAYSALAAATQHLAA
jgi:hypothetical protein